MEAKLPIAPAGGARPRVRWPLRARADRAHRRAGARARGRQRRDQATRRPRPRRRLRGDRGVAGTYGTASAVVGDDKLAAGLCNQTSFLRPITEGSIEAVATRRHRGRTTWVWEVEMSDDHGHLCVLSRVTIAGQGALASRPSRSPAAQPELDEGPELGVREARHRDRVRPGQAQQPAGTGPPGQDHRLAGRGQRRGERRRQRRARASAGRAAACRRRT